MPKGKYKRKRRSKPLEPKKLQELHRLLAHNTPQRKIAKILGVTAYRVSEEIRVLRNNWIKPEERAKRLELRKFSWQTQEEEE